MPLLTERYEDSSNPELEQWAANVQAIINNLDDDNIAVSAGIDMTKISGGEALAAHASQHATGGTDVLPKSSISGAMIQPRSINASHLGVESVQSSHLSPDAIFSNIHVDVTPISVAHGVTLDPPEGYEASKTACIIAGFDIQKSGGFDRMRLPINLYVKAGEAVSCYCWAYDGENPNIQVTGTVQVVRLAFK